MGLLMEFLDPGRQQLRKGTDKGRGWNDLKIGHIDLNKHQEVKLYIKQIGLYQQIGLGLTLCTLLLQDVYIDAVQI